MLIIPSPCQPFHPWEEAPDSENLNFPQHPYLILMHNDPCHGPLSITASIVAGPPVKSWDAPDSLGDDNLPQSPFA